APDQLEGLRTLRAERANQLNAARALLTSAVGLLEVLEPAVPPLEPVAPRPVRNAALAFVLGTFLVYGLVLLRDALDTRFRGGEDLVRSTNLPLLAEFPRMAPGTRLLPREASSYLRTNLTFATSASHPKVLLVTSAGAAQGKTSVACSLAESFARNDYRTLVVDADLRKPMVAQVFGVEPGAARLGGRTLSVRQLLEDPTLEGGPATVRLGGGTLDVLPQFGSAPSPTELLSRGFATMLNRFKDDYDVIVVDTPPMLPVADTLTMAPHTTGVVLAVSLPDTDRRSVGAAIDLLERIGVRMLGLVATNIEKTTGRAGEYGYGYGYGYGDDEGSSGTAGGGRRSPRRGAAPSRDAALSAAVNVGGPAPWWTRVLSNGARTRTRR
ncbi:MAG TPA: polysaccharide biosynthesis tyrosine autokinase, partial [Trueperaceae bacterium]|nr:polysaccharide biosynthesis tyrosine autokinase [Trueperaceae bacterium]